MFLGHFALGLAVKPLVPRQSLGLLIAAPMLLDIVFPFCLLTGLERATVAPGTTAFFPFHLDSLPWSHSLLAAVVWSVVWGLAVWLFTKDGRGALVGAALVASHWVLDWITHSPDLQLVPWSETRAGLGLWYSLAGTFAVELPLWAAGCAVYLTRTTPSDAIGRRVPVVYMFVLLGAYLATPFAPLPPSMRVLSVGMIVGLGLATAIAAWFDRHRTPRDVVV